MANHDQVELLRKGSAVWNAWREAHATECDLSGDDLFGANLIRADLIRADLTGANLIRANLVRSDLIGAYLVEAKLRGANLSGADLSGANLRGANLRGANLHGANLHGANLHEANLSGANLSGSSLKGTNLENATLYETVFADVDLSPAKGLEQCRHLGPSVVDFRTLAQSGPLPLAFLRGCGLPDALIDYLPSLLGSPIEFYSCFISYSSQDQQFAERLHADLQNKEVRCWFAPEDLKIGEKFRVTIDESIRVHDKLLLILSEHSVQSDWVEKEVETAIENERKRKQTVLFPIRLDDSVLQVESGWPGDVRRSRHIGDFRDWKNHDAYQKSFERLLRDLKAAAKTA